MVETHAEWKNRERLLWLGDQPDIEHHFRKLLPSEWDLLSARTVEEAEIALSQGEISIVCVDSSCQQGKALSFLERLRSIQPLIERALVVTDPSVVREAVNRCAPFALWGPSLPSKVVRQSVELARRRHRDAIHREQIMKMAGTKNRELEGLHKNLEALVLERTENIESSKNEIETKQKRMRELVRFVNDVSQIETVYDLTAYLRKEFRRFHKTEPPILVCSTGRRTVRILHFRGQQLIESSVRSPWPGIATTRFNERTDQEFLANELGRPVAPVLAFPVATGSDHETSPAAIFFENQLTAEAISDFSQFAAERVQPLGIALDRILLGEQVRAASLQWEKTFDAILAPVCIVDMDFQVLRANTYFSRQNGGKKCFQQFAKRETMCSGCPVADVLAGGRARTGLIRVQDKTWDVYSYPIRWRENPETTTVVNHYVDVTESKELYGKMIQGEKMAALGLLAANIAHELNNPLTGIRSLAQVLQKSVVKDPRLVEDLSEVEMAAERCQKIIRNLLEFTHSKPAEDVLFNLNESVQNTIPMLKTAMRYHNTGVDLSEEPIWVKGDPHLIQQVVFNLVNNACQAMRDPGTVSITTEKTEGWAKLHVEDSGPGIKPDLLDRIFDPFFTTKPEGEGTGLGLSMSRSIIQKYGGTLSVKNRDQGGCIFTVSLPVADSEKSA